MKIVIVIGCFLALGALASCSQDSECLVADSVKELKTIRIDDADYYLYRRTSGFNDKASFYQLYDRRPLLDRCGKAANQAVADVYIDTTEGYPVRILVSTGKLDLVYSKDSAATPDFDNVEVVVK